MKNSIIRKKITRLIILFSFLTAWASAIHAQTTITSTPEGGNWSSPSTWIGGVVPTAIDNVIINSTVFADNDTKPCNNLTLNAGAYLYNLYWGGVSVSGSVINNGSILNNPAGYPLPLFIQGNIENNGVWNVSSTTLTGTADQIISEAPGMSFEGPIVMSDSIGAVVLGSDVKIINNTWELNKSTIRTNGYRLIANSYTLKSGCIESNDTLALNNSYLDNMQFFGNYKLDGNVFLKQNSLTYDNVFNGTLTVLDTLANLWGVTILVNGDIVNKGAIIFTGYEFNLNLAGNVRNEGIWRPQVTNFVGAADQTIQQAPGKCFKSIINTTDTLGDIILESDVKFEPSADFQAGKTWYMNDANLRTNGHKLMSEDYIFKDGKIISNDTLVLNYSFINNMRFYGNYKLDGNVFSQYNSLPNHNVFNDTLTVLDTLAGVDVSTILVNGHIVNKGAIINNWLNGYPFTLNIAGSADNEGIWRPRETNFTGATDQTIQQAPGKYFQSIINTTDTIGDIILESDVMLKPSADFQGGKTWFMNNANLRTNGHKLMSEDYILTNGKIISNDTLVINNSLIDNMRFFGNYKLGGNVFSLSDYNVFNDTLTVFDTLVNNGPSTILINGDLVNKGNIVNNWFSGYALNLRVKGNITNHRFFTNSNVYLIGTNPRTISGLGIQAATSADDSIRLVDDNTLSNISFTGNPKAWCVVDTGATLNLKALNSPEKMLNFGRISFEREFDNTVPNTLTFYESSMSCNAGVLMNKLTIDHYGYQQHPTVTGTVNCWWRLRNYPQNFNDTLVWLTLKYKTDALNGNPEDSLKVFFSPNAGLTWTRISVGVSIDLVNHSVTIQHAPSYGHYLLSSTPIGITTFHPMVDNVEPGFGGNTGLATLYIFGAGFKNPSIAKLRLSGQEDIVADTSYLTSISGESMLAMFNLDGKAVGVYDLVLEITGDTTIIRTACFTVEQGERSNPWVVLSGRDRFLVNRWQTFTLNYGNTSNTDAVGTNLVFAINNLPGLEVAFPDVYFVLPQAIMDLGPDYTRIADSVPLFYLSDTLTGFIGRQMRVYPFYIPSIAAGSSIEVRVKVKLTGTGSLKMSAWMIDPYWENIDYGLKETEPMPAEVKLCLAAVVLNDVVVGAISAIPGAGCIFGLVEKAVEPFNGFIPEDMKPEDEKPRSWRNSFWNMVAWGTSIATCATTFVPVLGTAVAIGGAIVNIAMDAKVGGIEREGCWRKFRNKSKCNKDSDGVNSLDPNEIVGTQGFTPDNYISKTGELNYRIYFENKDTATAAALEVFVFDTLDMARFDLNTFSFNTITFGDTTLQIQDYAKEFAILVDMYPQKNIIVQVHGAIDTLNGAISWDFHSLDRITLELTEDPDLGFLPPNVISPEGEGNVSFSCKLKETVTHDEMISNKATIVFDFNPPISTNTYSNKIDDRVPVSFVNPLEPGQPDSNFTVSWQGSDEGCGIANFNIFVSENDSAYYLWKISGTAGSAVFNGHTRSNYKFFSLASDSLGFTEAQKLTPEAVTTIIVGMNDLNNLVSQFRVYPNPASSQVALDFNLISAQHVWVEIIDMYGKSLIQVNYNELPSGKNLKRISTDMLGNGIYNVTLHTNNSMLTHKLVICR